MIVVFVFLILIIILILIVTIGSSSHSNYEDPDFSSLRKLFFALKTINISFDSTRNPGKVFGVMIETEHPVMGRVIYASLINGFTGYYLAKGGGNIAGKEYSPGNKTVQNELIQMCNENGLIGKYQSRETKILARQLVLSANQYLELSRSFNNSFSISPHSSSFWFFTEHGYRCLEVINSDIHQSSLHSLVEDCFFIIATLDRQVFIKESKPNIENTKAL